MMSNHYLPPVQKKLKGMSGGDFIHLIKVLHHELRQNKFQRIAIQLTATKKFLFFFARNGDDIKMAK
jgi:hypothetical protein